jgi:hypothetical protein
LVFVVVAYSSTSDYVPDNEVQPKLHDLAAQRLIIFLRVPPVFIRALRRVCRLALAGLSAATPGVIGEPETASPFTLKRCVAASPTDPSAGHNPRENRDVDAQYTRAALTCQAVFR